MNQVMTNMVPNSGKRGPKPGRRPGLKKNDLQELLLQQKQQKQELIHHQQHLAKMHDIASASIPGME